MSQQNSGTPSVGRNKGIRAARGHFVAFLDADDLYAPYKIEDELDAFERCPDLDVVFGDVALFHDDPPSESPGLLDGLGFLKQAASYMEHVEGSLYRCKPSFYNFISTKISVVNTQTVMIRRTLLQQESILFREDWHIGEDLDLWFQLARRARFGYLAKVLSFYRQRPDSLTRNIEHASVGFIWTHSANLERGRDVFSTDEIKVIQSRLARQHMHLGYLYFTQGRMSEARASYRCALKLSPEHFSRTAFAKTLIPYPLVKLLHKARRCGTPRA
jgi:glycosyltransferase involved in cell wall biosynthesis